LVRRLALAALIISALLGAAVYVVEGRKVGDAVVNRATQAAELFSAYASDSISRRGLPDRAEIQGELEAFASVQMVERTGRFVSVTLENMDGERVAGLDDSSYADLSAARDVMASLTPPAGAGIAEAWSDSKWVDGVPYVVAAAPLLNSDGKVAGRFFGVYAVSRSAVEHLRARVIRSIVAVVLIVLVTTGLLYPLITTLLRRMSKLTYSLLDSNLETLRVLGSAIAKRDSDTDAHNYRVTIISVRLAEKIGLESEAMKGLIKGAFVHDVGKIGVRDSVLLKPGPLSPDEFDAMKDHVDHGLDIVERSDWLSDAMDVVGYHHEKYDGTGYRNGLSGDSIPVGARIFAIADVFDALTSRRPYKEPFTLEETMSVLEKGRKTHFDPEILDAFAKIAEGIYRNFADRDDDLLRKEVDEIIERYFQKETAVLL
jgi:HD-GYP domain-containing protein (c-di-GMP phosphodiesterase class II)